MNERAKKFHYQHNQVTFHQYSNPENMHWLGWYELGNEVIAFVQLDGGVYFDW